MEIFYTLLGLAFFLTVVALLGHGIWLVMAAILRALLGTPSKSSNFPVTDSAEEDLAQSYFAIDRLYRGKIISADAFRQSSSVIEDAAKQIGFDLPWIASKELTRIRSKRNTTPSPSSTNQRLDTEEPPIVLHSDESESQIPLRQKIETVSVHPLEQEYAPPPPPLVDSLATQTKRTLGNVLQQFLSEKNIHWGELVSAMLIVGSAVGLILSLRTELNRLVPMFPSVLFFLVTISLHLAGFYTLKRWKLPSTSRGLLLLGSIMMCVTSFASVLLSEQTNEPMSSMIPLVVGAIGFGSLSYLSSKSLFPAMRLLWTTAVTCTALAPVILARWLEPQILLAELKWSSHLAILGFFITVMGLVVSHFRLNVLKQTISLRSQLRLLGITFVGSLFSGGLILFFLFGTNGDLSSFSLMLSLLGGLLVSAGAIVHFQCCESESRRISELSESLLNRVAVISSAVSFSGAGVMVLSLGSAWSNSSLFLEAACINAVVSIAMVFLWRNPTLTAIASSFIVLSSWLLVHRVSGDYPANQMEVSWLIQALGTVRSSGTFFVLAGIFSGLAFAVGREHRIILLFTGAFVFAVGLSVAGYLGITTKAYGPQAYSIACFALLGVIACLASTIKARIDLAATGIACLLFAWFILGRPSTELSMQFGIRNSNEIDFATFTLSGHAVTTVFIAAAVSLFRFNAIGSRFLPFISRRLVEPRIEKWICDTGLISAAACVPLLIRIEPAFDWLWQASLLAVLALCYWVGWIIGRGVTRESISWFISGSALCFFLALGMVRVLPPSVLASSCLSIAAASVFLIGTGCAIALSKPKRILRSKIKLKAWSTAYGDGLLVVLSLMFGIHLILKSKDWWQSALISSSNAIGWTAAILILFGCLIILTAFRQRSLYIWLTGAMSTTVVFTSFGIWSKGGGDMVAFVYLLAAAPQLVACAANAIDMLRRKQTISQFATKGSYESVVATITVMLWALATIVGYLANQENTLTRFYGLWSPVGGLWVAIGLLSFWLASHVVNRNQFVFYLLLGTLFISWNLPIAIARTLATKLDPTMSLSLLFVGVAIQTMCIAWFVSNGMSLSRYISRFVKSDDVAARTESQEMCWNYTNLMSIGLGVACLVIAVVTKNPEVVRLQALAVALLAFANGFLMRCTREEFSSQSFPWVPTLLNRYLMLIFACLFVLFAEWSWLENLDTAIVSAKRIARTAAVMMAATIAIGIAYAWVRRTQGRNSSFQLDSTKTQVDVGSTLSDRPVRKTFDRRELEDWSETLSKAWSVAATLAGTFLFISSFVIFVSTNPNLISPSGLIVKSDFKSESLWLAALTVAWAVQLIIQALRPAWNVAKFSDSIRSAYVYIAELAVVFTGAILVTIFPEWFQFPMREYWPILMLILAVVVQGAAMFLKRVGITTLADPLHNTSFLLPLIAPFAMLFIATDASLEMVLALGALFYFFLGATERSRQLAMIGGTFANGALLSFWSRFESLRFSEHPQLWLIPPAASIVLATHVERERISKETASWLRYLCMAAIFCSSSSEILIQGLGRSLWPPMVLMVLSLMVGFLGIAFQVKSYLYSSLLFTLFALVAMVAHAQQSVQHTWPWWVLGITLGIGIMTLFAMFERKRDQLIRLSDMLKSWE